MNNMPAQMDEKVYENFTIQCELKDSSSENMDMDTEEDLIAAAKAEDGLSAESNTEEAPGKAVLNEAANVTEKKDLYVIINKEPVRLSNKSTYIFVDIFDFYPFDLKKAGGSELVITLNGEKADFIMPLHEKDIIELYWK